MFVTRQLDPWTSRWLAGWLPAPLLLCSASRGPVWIENRAFRRLGRLRLHRAADAELDGLAHDRRGHRRLRADRPRRVLHRVRRQPAGTSYPSASTSPGPTTPPCSSPLGHGAQGFHQPWTPTPAHHPLLPRASHHASHQPWAQLPCMAGVHGDGQQRHAPQPRGLAAADCPRRTHDTRSNCPGMTACE